MSCYIKVRQSGPGDRVGILDTEAWEIAAFSTNEVRRDAELRLLQDGGDRSCFNWSSVKEQSADFRGGPWAHMLGGRWLDLPMEREEAGAPVGKHCFLAVSE